MPSAMKGLHLIQSNKSVNFFLNTMIKSFRIQQSLWISYEIQNYLMYTVVGKKSTFKSCQAIGFPHVAEPALHGQTAGRRWPISFLSSNQCFSPALSCSRVA
jgi:hypothetical protein